MDGGTIGCGNPHKDKGDTFYDPKYRVPFTLATKGGASDNQYGENGAFYASQKGLTGPLGNQATLYNQVFRDESYQTNANKAIHSFLP